MATDRSALATTRGWATVGRYALLVFVSVVVLFPVWVMVVASLKPGNKVLQQPLLPTDFTTDTLRESWTEGDLGRALLNSLVVAVIVMVFQTVTSLLAAYAFVFLEFRGKALVFGVYLSTLLIPFEATALFNRKTVEQLGWLNSFQGLALPFLATAFGTFLIRQVFMALPKELSEAARMDGLSHWGFLREVAVPLVRPTIGALALFAFLSSWNQYLWPTLARTDEKWNTVQTGLRALASADLDKPNLVIAGTVIAALPILVVLVVFQRQLVRGLTAGAVKG
jgi:sn-glycerol 3-phosphate transport system permease protein